MKRVGAAPCQWFSLGVLDLAQVVLRELDLGWGDVFFEPVQLGRAGDGDDPRFLREDPGERDLRGCRVVALRDLVQEVDEGAVRSAGVLLEPRVVGPEVVVVERAWSRRSRR
jgi:hypothetical protein